MILPCSRSFLLPRLTYTCTVSPHQAMKRKSLTLFTQQGDVMCAAVLVIVYILSSHWDSPPALVVFFFPLFPSSAASMKERGDYHSILLDPRGPVSFQTLLCLCVCGRKRGRLGPLKGSVTHPQRLQREEYKFLTLHFCLTLSIPFLWLYMYFWHTWALF